MKYHLTPIRKTTINLKKKKKQKITNAGTDVEEKESLCTVDGNQKIKHRTTKQPSNPTSGHISKII